MLESTKSHLPLIVIAVVSVAAILYLYRELQKAKRELLSARSEHCEPALCKDAKRVRFADEGAAATKPPAAAKKAKAKAAAPPPDAAAEGVAAGAAQEGALESDQ
jgi:hypothetical protein